VYVQCGGLLTLLLELTDPFLSVCENGFVKPEMDEGVSASSYIAYTSTAIIMSNIENNNHLDLEPRSEAWARWCLDGHCSHDEDELCAKQIATDGWYEGIEECRLMTVEEYRGMAPSIAEEFLKRWLKEQGGGLCSQLTVDSLRKNAAEAEICDLAALDSAIVHSCYRCEDYDDGSQPPRAKHWAWKDIPRRSHDDGFDEYDGDDEEWETESQEEERRQEMAEEKERQEEAYADLNRAVFEHSSEATADPHIRISHLSPVVPDNWMEIAMRGVK